MPRRAYLLFSLLLTVPAWSQVEPEAEGGPTPVEDTQMMTPPPVSGVPYPHTATLQGSPNYLSAGVSANGGYVNNILQSSNTPPVNDGVFSVYPTFMLARSTPHQQATITYSPSFVFYQPTSVLDTVNQGASLTYQDRLSPHVTFNAEDSFYRTSDVFDQSYFFSDGGVTGSSQNPSTTVIAPFAQQLSNSGQAFLSYQFARNGMIGAGGSYQTADFSAPGASTGLANSNQAGAWAFYNRRLTQSQYFGFVYQYARTLAQQGSQQSDTQLHSLLPFYTFYFAHAFSVSISGGAQRVGLTLPNLPAAASWSPALVASLGWQRDRGYLAGNYSHTVTSGQGLFGAFKMNSIGLSGGWRLGRTWDAAMSISYSNTSNAVPQLVSYAGGSSIAGQASLTHTIHESFSAAFGYQRLHQQYSGIAIISADPDSNRVYAGITYSFLKPLGK
jgi:hypothetical protein